VKSYAVAGLIHRSHTINVVKKVIASGAIKPSFNHAGVEGTIPLPATLIHDLSKLLGDAGVTVKLYSPFPFPNRADRKLDEFGTDAWAALEHAPDQIFVKSEVINGREIVRVGVGDTMVSQVCVDCHNRRADTPKNDWELNQLRGILEINNDITDQINRGALLSTTLSLVVIAIMVAVMVIVVLRMRSVVLQPVGELTHVMGALAGGQHEIDIPATQREDELGKMARAVSVFKENALERERLQGEQSQAQQTRQARAERVEKLIEGFDGTVNRVLSVVDDIDVHANNGSGHQRSIRVGIKLR
jgi:methyl-accepting chemotaxis protein